MRNLAGIAAMMALSGGYDQGDRGYYKPKYRLNEPKPTSTKSKKTLKRRAANKKARKQRHG